MKHGNCKERQNAATPEVHSQGLLTEDEYALKQILVSSQHFLNRTQSLLKIETPTDALPASGNTYRYGSDRLVLDTSCELIRRKSKREEAQISRIIPYAPVKVRSLDDLVKELNDDLRSLDMPSKTEAANNDIAECLLKMIESEMQNRNPDINCMWDMCWNNLIFANIDEITRDLEKHVLNGLINDLARDLISVSIAVG